MPVRRVLVELAGLDEFGEQRGPLRPQHVGPAEAAVAADHDEPVDAARHQVRGGAAAAGPVAELGRPRRAQHGAATGEDVADVVPPHAADPVTAVDEALVALEHGVDLGTVVQGAAHDRPDGRIHALRVAPAGEHGKGDAHGYFFFGM